MQPYETPTPDNVPTPNNPVPAAPTPEPTPPQKPASSKKMIWIFSSVIAVLVLAIVGLILWNVLAKDDGKKDTDDTTATSSRETSSSSTQSSGDTTSQLKTVSYTVKDATVTIDVPSTWEVTDTADGKTLRTDNGNYLNLRDATIGGLGGLCTGNSDTYTLEHIVATGDPQYVFKDYQLSDGTSAFQFEDTQSGPTEHDSLQVGESNTDTCKLFSYPIYKRSIYIIMTSVKSTSTDSSLTYEQFSSDKAFVTAIGTLQFK